MNEQIDFNKILEQLANDLQTLTICLTLAREHCEDVNVHEAAAAADRLVNTYKQMEQSNQVGN